ncbi:MAG: hypothetical protein ABSE51_18480 [Terracidiphilus sp.]|jgi:hypothetical protein
MTLIKKSDVKMHFSSSQSRGLHLVEQVNKPAVDVRPMTNIAIELNATVFADDFSVEHSSPGGTVSAIVIVANLSDTQIQEIPGHSSVVV